MRRVTTDCAIWRGNKRGSSGKPSLLPEIRLRIYGVDSMAALTRQLHNLIQYATYLNKNPRESPAFRHGVATSTKATASEHISFGISVVLPENSFSDFSGDGVSIR
jgi:hypothetical protein